MVTLPQTTPTDNNVSPATRTPGPYHTVGHGLNVYVVDSGDRIIASCYPDLAVYGDYGPSVHPQNPKACGANARFLAMAPDLLAACQQLAGTAESLRIRFELAIRENPDEFFPGRAVLSTLTRDIKQCAEVIEKAEGGAS